MSDQIHKIRKVIENIKRNKIESIKLQKIIPHSQQ